MTDAERGDDPTAEWLDGIRAEPAPWRTDRPAGQETPAGEVTYREQARRFVRARDLAREAAPYLPLATYAGFLAAENAAHTDDDAGDGGQDFGADGGDVGG